MSVRVAISLGSNLGDRLQNLRKARAMILALPGIVPADPQQPGLSACLCAPMFETEPIGCPPGSAPFFNTVIEIGLGKRLSPLQLLRALRQIERTLGRPSRYPRNASRCIDLDILYAGQLVMATSELSLPHPRLAARRFVLIPLATIRPGLTLPGHRASINELLQRSDDHARVEQVLETW